MDPGGVPVLGDMYQLVLLRQRHRQPYFLRRYYGHNTAKSAKEHPFGLPRGTRHYVRHGIAAS